MKLIPRDWDGDAMSLLWPPARHCHFCGHPGATEHLSTDEGLVLICADRVACQLRWADRQIYEEASR